MASCAAILGTGPKTIMSTPKDTPNDLAKQTLVRLARDRQLPVPENYCSTYRRVDGKPDNWIDYCHYTRLLQESLMELVESWQAASPLVEPETARSAKEFGEQVRNSVTDEDLKRIRESCNSLGVRMKRDLMTGAEVQQELLDVMQMVVGNLSVQGEEDRWLHNQLQSLDRLLARKASVNNLEKAKAILKEVLDRQGRLQTAMAESQQTLKAVMAELIRQAASMVQDSSGYESRIEELGQHIQSANDLTSIKDVVKELDGFVREMGTSVRHNHETMASAHTRLVQAEQQIVDLRRHLEETSEKVRRDTLTGALNRSGLDEIWRREVERARTDSAPLSVGILDVDNFKLLNDQLGHTAGDEALVHLTGVIRNALHGTDTMARYGGEEFVILLPDTDIKGAEAVMQRLQRELTKHFFMHGEEKLLITFSAGVTAVDLARDTLLTTIERADTALYRAKHQGKNRVVAAETA